MQFSDEYIATLTGMKFGRLTIIGASHRDQKGSLFVLCKCECEVVRPFRFSSVKRGNTKSCGCYMREVSSRIAREFGGYNSHGHTRVGWASSTYKTWAVMKQRCLNPKNKQYPDYGGRGITCCVRWNEFENFLCDMGERPDPEYSLDRIDNDGPYSPDNCRWTTRTIQNRNTRRNRLLTIGGVTRPLSEWAEIKGLKPSCIYTRLAHGWSEEKAVTEPVKIYRTRRKSS